VLLILPGRERPIDLETERFRNIRPWIDICRMQPTAPEIDRVAVAMSDAMCSTTDPIARFY
jgi:hypothetical protein